MSCFLLSLWWSQLFCYRALSGITWEFKSSNMPSRFSWGRELANLLLPTAAPKLFSVPSKTQQTIFFVVLVYQVSWPLSASVILIHESYSFFPYTLTSSPHYFMMHINKVIVSKSLDFLSSFNYTSFHLSNLQTHLHFTSHCRFSELLLYHELEL